MQRKGKITGLPWSQEIGGDSVGHEGGGGYGAVNGMSPPHPAVVSPMALSIWDPDDKRSRTSTSKQCFGFGSISLFIFGSEPLFGESGDRVVFFSWIFKNTF